MTNNQSHPPSIWQVKLLDSDSAMVAEIITSNPKIKKVGLPISNRHTPNLVIGNRVCFCCNKTVTRRTRHARGQPSVTCTLFPFQARVSRKASLLRLLLSLILLSSAILGSLHLMNGSLVLLCLLLLPCTHANLGHGIQMQAAATANSEN